MSHLTNQSRLSTRWAETRVIKLRNFKVKNEQSRSKNKQKNQKRNHWKLIHTHAMMWRAKVAGDKVSLVVTRKYKVKVERTGHIQTLGLQMTETHIWKVCVCVCVVLAIEQEKGGRESRQTRHCRQPIMSEHFSFAGEVIQKQKKMETKNGNKQKHAKYWEKSARDWYCRANKINLKKYKTNQKKLTAWPVIKVGVLCSQLLMFVRRTVVRVHVRHARVGRWRWKWRTCAIAGKSTRSGRVHQQWTNHLWNGDRSRSGLQHVLQECASTVARHAVVVVAVRMLHTADRHGIWRRARSGRKWFASIDCTILGWKKN